MSVKNNNSIVGIVNNMIMNNMNSSFFCIFKLRMHILIHKIKCYSLQAIFLSKN